LPHRAFTQEDPIGIAGGLNLYGYADGDPINFSDPFGLCPWCFAVAGAAIGGGLVDAGIQVAINLATDRPALEGTGTAFALGAVAGVAGFGIGRWVSRGTRVVGRTSRKIARQMSPRGWTGQSIDEVLNHPHATRQATNRATGNRATAFFREDGSYVVRDDVTEEIVQISNRNDPNWIPDRSIEDPYRPGGQ
jgi:hypothetical protein